MKRFRLTLLYSDRCFFKKVIEIQALNSDEAIEIFEDGETCAGEDYFLISDELIEKDGNPYCEEIDDIEEMEDKC